MFRYVFLSRKFACPDFDSFTASFLLFWLVTSELVVRILQDFLTSSLTYYQFEQRLTELNTT